MYRWRREANEGKRMPDKGAVKVFGPCQAPLQTTYRNDSIFSPLDSFKRTHSACSNGGFGHTMICAQLLTNVASGMSDSNSPQKQTRKKHKGRHATDAKVHGEPLERIDEEDLCAEDSRRRDASRRLFSSSSDVTVANSIEAIRKEGLRVRRSRLEEDILRLHKRLRNELDLREALEIALSDASAAIPEHVPLKVRKLLQDIAILEVTVLSLEDQVLASQWQLCKERKESAAIQNSAPSSFRQSKAFDRIPQAQYSQNLFCQEDPSCSALVDELSPVTPGLRKSSSRLSRYSDAESSEQQEDSSYEHGNLALTISGEPDTPRRSSFWSNCSDEDYGKSHKREKCDFAESERIKHRKHQRKKTRQKHSELVACSSCPETPPQEFDDTMTLSRRSSLLLKGLALHPNRLSEKMLRCMMDIYCHLSDTAPFTASSSPTSPFTQAITTPSMSSLSESSFLSFGKSPLVELPNKEDIVGSESLFDPYRTKEKLSWVDIGVYSSALEIRWIAVGKEQLGYAARALREYKLLVEQLAKVDILSMAHEEKLAFWVNIYNALVMHGYLAYGIPNSELKSFFLLQKASYVIGGHTFTALAIEYHLLKHKAPAHRPQIALLLALHKIKLTLEQTSFAVDYPEPLTVFALSCGARSSPLVKVYTPDNVIQQLKSSLHDYIRASVGLGVRGKVLIPKLLYTYAHENMEDSSLLAWIYLHLPSPQVAVIRECLQQRRHRFLSSRNFSILPFDFRFQYLFLRS
ncbi:uncharacterized protein LOC9661160 [Selaginella moellendorffii]|uniref:uncharacterized protein LOC9661160 n=1 Tax=Selaginella moellendorffii TaxID=88036 RepID=UPI000D1CDF2A|nr:uncharacterized protein LOC9661160 [Selaginella moellendorffii]|eukprot:XP_024515984.1 uncharacterized protein LOC9661160 [Selaginella moellendorffii]